MNLKLMSAKSLQVCAVERHTDIATPWAPMGAKYICISADWNYTDMAMFSSLFLNEWVLSISLTARDGGTKQEMKDGR